MKTRTQEDRESDVTATECNCCGYGDATLRELERIEKEGQCHSS